MTTRPAALCLLPIALLGQVPPTLTQPTVSPAAVRINSYTTIVITSRVVGDPSAIISTGVNAIVADEMGGAPRVLGLLRDDGVGGDSIPNDGVFSGSFVVATTTKRQIYTTAPLRGSVRRIMSQLTLLDVDSVFPLQPRPFNSNRLIETTTGAPVVCDELLVIFSPTATLLDIQTVLVSVTGSVVGRVPSLGIHQVSLPSCSAPALQAALTVIRASPVVVAASLHGTLLTRSFIPNDPRFLLQWGLVRINVPNAWGLLLGSLGTPRRGQAIGMIDTGVLSSHEDLTNVLKRRNLCATVANGLCVSESLNPIDQIGHGTFTSGIAAALSNNSTGVAGVSFGALIVAEQVFPPTGPTSWLSVALGIEDAVQAGARVINLSLGASGVASDAPPLARAVQYALDRHVAVVAAAGNDNCSDTQIPAVLPGVISVGAIDESDSRSVWGSGPCVPDANNLASNYGSWVDVYAPGTNIDSTSMSGGYGLVFGGGTSAAAPFVSGVASLLLTANNALTGGDVKRIVKATARRTGKLDVPGGREIVVVDAHAAVQVGLNPSTVVAAGSLESASNVVSVTQSLGYVITGPGAPEPAIENILPASKRNLPPGQYTITYSGGGPPNSTLVGINPCVGPIVPPNASCTQTVNAGQTLTFTLRFATNPPPNQPPTAGFLMTASGQPSVTEGNTLNLVLPVGQSFVLVDFNGTTRSRDPENGPLSYEWKSNGTRIPSPTFTGGMMQFGLGVGTHIISLEVVDNQGARSTPSTGTVVVTQSAPPPVGTSDAFADFSLVSNPNGRWSYGYSDGLTGAFQLHPTARADFVPGVDGWATPAIDPFFQIARNKTGSTIIGSPATFTYPPDMLHMHPTLPNRYDIVRWTAPSSGTFTIQGKFAGLDFVTSVADTDVHVRLNGGTSLFTALLRGSGTEAPFSITRALNTGDIIDFAVGRGPSGFHQNDSTGLKATISPTAVPTGSMSIPRQNFTATLLNSGLVLVTGGYTTGGTITDTAELYDPQTGVWRNVRRTALGGGSLAMTTRRVGHTATLLSNGMVLIAGGSNSVAGLLNSAELFNPDIETFTATPPMPRKRDGHKAVRLNDGRVILIGGADAHFSFPTVVDVYNPASGTWDLPLRPLPLPVVEHAVVLIPDGGAGKVLVTGCNLCGVGKRVQLYDPASDTWRTMTDMLFARQTHTASVLPNGKVLIAGGNDGFTANYTAELYDITANNGNGQSTLVGPVSVGGWRNTATTLSNGNVLLTGGYNYPYVPTENNACCALSVDAVQMYNFSSGAITTLSPMTQRRGTHTATLLPSGKVLVAGGVEYDYIVSRDGRFGTAILSSSEIIQP